MAQKAIVSKIGLAKVPTNLGYDIAAALPNALLGSDAALLYRAKIKAGDTVLVNGATGVSGKMAVQIAKYRGAARVIAMGRNAAILVELKNMGADETVSLKQNDDEIITAIKAIQQQTPIDIVLDYLWGHPIELLLIALKSCAPRRIKIVTIGEMAGSHISLASGSLRSTQIELLGSGIGSISKEEIGSYFKNELPIMFELAAAGKIKIAIETASLEHIETVWNKEVESGKRLVVIIQ